MKIGVSSYSFTKYMKASGCDYLKICDLAREIGYDGIEFVDLKPEIGGQEDLTAIAREIRAHCAKIGLEVTAYTVGANFLAEDPSAELKRLQGCVDVAEALGAQVMRHDACWNPASHTHGYTWRDAVATIAPYIRALTEYAQDRGIRTCTENHGLFMQDAHRVEALIMEVGHPNYGWLIDMGNFLCADEEPTHALSVAAPYAFHVHAKDFLFKPGSALDPGEGWFKSRGGNYLRGTIVGHGVVPIPQCVSLLKNSGYEGNLSLEFEGLEDNLTALKLGYAYLKRFA